MRTFLPNQRQPFPPHAGTRSSSSAPTCNTHRSPCLLLATTWLALSGLTWAQETRGMIYGRVTDPQGAVVPGVQVTVTNVDTNTSVKAVTNESGYYEANLLIHGNYQVSFEASGFRRLLRRGIVLPMSSRVEVSATLELGVCSAHNTNKDARECFNVTAQPNFSTSS